MLDRVREALFSTLVPWLVAPSEEASMALVLDLFAGSGSLGLEALSRGARSVRFVEHDGRALATLRGNLAALGLEPRTEVVDDDALEPRAWGGDRTADVVFLDPPYGLLEGAESRLRVLAALHGLARHVLAHQGVLVLHAPRRRLDASEFEPELVVRERAYGSSSLWYVQREAEA